MPKDAQRYILEIDGFDGSEVSLAVRGAGGEPLSTYYAIVLVDAQGASIVDSGYLSVTEAKGAWPEAKEPSGNHLTPSAADERAIRGTLGATNLSE